MPIVAAAAKHDTRPPIDEDRLRRAVKEVQQQRRDAASSQARVYFWLYVATVLLSGALVMCSTDDNGVLQCTNARNVVSAIITTAIIGSICIIAYAYKNARFAASFYTSMALLFNLCACVLSLYIYNVFIM